ncbi:hypothetical protein MRX96_045582 [Rhipicephalus microplus]
MSRFPASVSKSFPFFPLGAASAVSVASCSAHQRSSAAGGYDAYTGSGTGSGRRLSSAFIRERVPVACRKQPGSPSDRQHAVTSSRQECSDSVGIGVFCFESAFRNVVRDSCPCSGLLVYGKR